MREKNKKGIIASTYAELQSIPILERASMIYPVEKCSTWSTVKALTQSTEIGIQNLNDLGERIVKDLRENEIEKALLKFGWLKDITFLIGKLINMVSLLFPELSRTETRLVNYTEVASLNKLTVLIKKIDKGFDTYFKKNTISINTIFQEKNLDNCLFNALHKYRISTREIIVWVRQLKQCPLPQGVTYENFVGLKEISEAVGGLRLKGDTFFTQFRCLHQIPEVITAESNDYIESAIIFFRQEQFGLAQKRLKIANTLLEITLESLLPIINNLSFNNYHDIRENLGLTSGSHSVNIHFYLFRDLYGIIAEEFVNKFFKNEKTYVIEIARRGDLKGLELELLRLKNVVDKWRNAHLHLPRNNVGENHTKSLIGSRDAIVTAENMQRTANVRDPLNKITNLYIHAASGNELSSLEEYLISEISLDKIIGSNIGRITQKRFSNVQERKGIFAEPPKFISPKKRKP